MRRLKYVIELFAFPQRFYDHYLSRSKPARVKEVRVRQSTHGMGKAVDIYLESGRHIARSLYYFKNTQDAKGFCGIIQKHGVVKKYDKFKADC